MLTCYWTGEIFVDNVKNNPEPRHVRPEYWVVSKDVASSPETGDELSFGVNGDGSVEFSRNGQVFI